MQTNLTKGGKASARPTSGRRAWWRKMLSAACLTGCLGAATASAELSVTVLGSGGPFALTDRASAGYLVEVDGVPRIMMDGGGGTFLRLGQGRIFNMMRLDMWLMSHLHADHVGDFAPIIKSIYYLRRSYNIFTPLTVIGPDAWGEFPSTSQFVDMHFGDHGGVYSYLHDFLRTVYALDMKLESIDVPYDYQVVTEPQKVFEKDGVVISSIPVMHGPREGKTPSVAFRVDYNGQSITYSGDLNSSTGNLVRLAMGTDVLIYDTALRPGMRIDPPDLFHSLPSEIGQAAQAAGAKKLVLSHLMPPYTDNDIAQIVRAVKRYYSGEVIVASDLLEVSAQ